MKSLKSICLVAAIVSAFVSQSLWADILAFNYTTPITGQQGGAGGPDGPWNLADLFTVHQPIEVTALGAFDSNQDGLVNPIPVAIYNTANTATPVVSATLTTADSILPAGSAYRYESVAPVVLLPGTYLVLGSNYGGPGTEMNADTFWGDPAPTFNTDGGRVTLGSGGNIGFFSSYTGSPAYPTNLTPETFGSGSFAFVAVPEPASLALLAMAAIGLCIAARRQRSA